MNIPDQPFSKPTPDEWQKILAEGGGDLMASPYMGEGRRKLADALESNGYQYPARSLLSGKLIPLLGRAYFPPRVRTFSIFDADAADHGVSVIPVEPQPLTEGWLPASVGISPVTETMNARPRWKRKHFVAQLQNGHCVLSPWGYAIFSKNEHYSVDFCCNDGPMIAWSGVVPQPTYIPGTVAVLAHSWSHAVFHWIMESMPRMELLRLAGFPPETDKIDRIVVRSLEKWHHEFIERLEIPIEKFVEVGHIGHITADTLLVCSNVEESDWTKDPPYFEPEPWVTRLVADFIPDENPVSPTERIYISRANAGSRRIANGDDLKLFLEKNSFRTVFFEDKTMAEKAAIMRSAAVVVTPSGAALTNIPYMRPGTKCVVLYPEDHFVSLFNAICANVGVVHIHAVFPSIVRYFPGQFCGVAEHLREQLIDIPHLADILNHFNVPVAL